MKIDKEQIIKKAQLQIKNRREQLKLIDKKVYKKNKFNFYEEEYPWTPVYIDLEKYNESEEIYTTYFSHIYQDLLSECSDALKMPYLFSFVPDKKVIDGSLFIKDTSSRVKNKNEIIKKSAYLLNLVKTFENNEYDIFSLGSVHALFEYDDTHVIEIIRIVLISFLVRSSDAGVSKRLADFKKNTKEALKSRKIIEKKKTLKKLDAFLKIDEVNNDVSHTEESIPKWFPIGLGFATGEIEKPLKMYLAREIVGRYDLKGYQNYITCTGIDSKKDPKNIYSDIKKLKLIYNHCIKNGIEMCANFKEAYEIKLKEIVTLTTYVSVC